MKGNEETPQLKDYLILKAKNISLRTLLVIVLCVSLVTSVAIPYVQAKFLSNGDVVFSAELDGFSNEDLLAMIEQYKCGRDTGHTACNCFSASPTGGLSLNNSTGAFSVNTAANGGLGINASNQLGINVASDGALALSGNQLGVNVTPNRPIFKNSNFLDIRYASPLTMNASYQLAINGWNGTADQVLMSNASGNGVVYRGFTNNTATTTTLTPSTNLVTANTLHYFVTGKLSPSAMQVASTSGQGITRTNSPAVYYAHITNGSSNLSGIVIVTSATAPIYFIGTTHGSSNAYSAYSTHNGNLTVGTSFSFDYQRGGNAINNRDGTETKNITGIRYVRLFYNPNT